MVSYTIFPVHINASAGGFVAYIAPLDGGVDVLARSYCPMRARDLGHAELRRRDQIVNDPSTNPGAACKLEV
jgi:hypothetical protein